MNEASRLIVRLGSTWAGIFMLCIFLFDKSQQMHINKSIYRLKVNLAAID